MRLHDKQNLIREIGERFIEVIRSLGLSVPKMNVRAHHGSFDDLWSGEYRIEIGFEPPDEDKEAELSVVHVKGERQSRTVCESHESLDRLCSVLRYELKRYQPN